MWVDGHPVMECFKCGGHIVLDDPDRGELEENRIMAEDHFELLDVQIGHKVCPMDSHPFDANL